MKLRLDKYLTEMGCGTRSQVKKEILKGSVSVNGEIAKKAERKVDTEKDEIIFKGEKIFYAGYEYFMLNKPAGVVSATEDKKERTVIDLIKESKRKDLFPAGRLDKDTEGLLLITNDGQLAHRLLSPKKHVDKIYYAKIKGIVTEEDVRLFEKGVHIGDEKPTMPAALEILSVQKDTMGIHTILGAKKILLVGFGARCAKAANATLTGRPETFIPASFLQLHTDVEVYLDADAAAQL